MNKEITVSNQISEDEVQLLKDTVCRGATNDELKLFVAIARKTGLDPFTKQIYAVKRWDSNLGREVMTTQTGIDGFRLIASRTGFYAGQLGPFWCGEDGDWKDVWLKKSPPVASKVAVLHSQFKEPLWAVAKFESYAQRLKSGELSRFWAKMPELMIAKVAESLALRKAFPAELSGLYTPDEMSQAENEPEETKMPTVAEAPKQVAAEFTRPASQAIPAASKSEPQKMESAGDFIMHFGKDTKGKKLSELTAFQISGALRWVKTKANQDFRDAQKTKEFIFWSERYLKKACDEDLDAALNLDSAYDIAKAPLSDWQKEDFT
jgi:phage recombination protein Bet